MDCAVEQTTIENRLGRTGGLAALCGSSLCPPDLPTFALPILSRSGALLSLLLQDGTVDLELTSAVVALDPGLALGTLQLANLERNGDGEIWQLPLAVVAAGCDRLLAMVNSALRVESSYDCGTGARFRQLYLRGVERACIAEWLTHVLGAGSPMPAYVAGLLSGLPRMASLADAKSPELLRCEMEIPPGARCSAGAAPLGRMAGCTPLAASVLLADRVLELPGREITESSPQLQKLAACTLWEAWDSCRMQDRCRLLMQGEKLGRWVAANAPRLSPWDFMARLHRRKSWE
jgi:HDOD domain